MLALARSAGPLAFATTPAILAQNDFFLPASALVFGLGAGAFRLLPVSRLYLARPFAVSPAPLDTGSFSPRPTDSEVDLRGMLEVGCYHNDAGRTISTISAIPASVSCAAAAAAAPSPSSIAPIPSATSCKC